VPGDYEILRTDKNVCATLPGNSHAIAVSGIKTSRPVHTRPELRDALDKNTWDSLLVSPVFPSISKPGHAPLPSQFPAFELRQLLSTNPRQTAVIALGGVTPDKLPALRELGFDGAAALGFVWNSPTPLAALRQLLHAT
jgi:thiamine-phosphate pyrophosphorylase